MESAPIQPEVSKPVKGKIVVKALKNGKWETVQTLTAEQFELYQKLLYK